MTDISIQFHATREELVRFAQSCIRDLTLHIVAIRFFPFEPLLTDAAGLGAIVSDESGYERLAFTLGQPVMHASNGTEFLENNPDSLTLDIGRRMEGTLEQSWLACRTADFGALMTWKEIAKRLKAITRTGVVAINASTGATTPAKSFRYTTGALALQESGVTMTQQGGGCLLKLLP